MEIVKVILGDIVAESSVSDSAEGGVAQTTETEADRDVTDSFSEVVCELGHLQNEVVHEEGKAHDSSEVCCMRLEAIVAFHVGRCPVHDGRDDDEGNNIEHSNNAKAADAHVRLEARHAANRQEDHCKVNWCVLRGPNLVKGAEGARRRRGINVKGRFHVK